MSVSPSVSDRVCCVCGRGARARHGFQRRAEDEPLIISITPYLYRSGVGKARTVPAPKVQICERCLHLALAEVVRPSGRPVYKFLLAVRASLAYRFGSLVEDEAFDQVCRPSLSGGDE